MAPVSDMEMKVEGRREGALSREDCLCPVCLEIFMEPVTLPCKHTFCKACFLESVDKATLCCPMCRKRVSTWARLNTRNKSLVNQHLWGQIQTCFPQQCQRRLSGHEDGDGDGDDSGLVCVPRVSRPGELRQEYEDELIKVTEERRVLEEEELKASEELIQRMLAEEEQLLQEEALRRQEDEHLALTLSHQLNRPPVAPVRTKDVGQIEKFLCPRPSQGSAPRLQSSAPRPQSSAPRLLSNKENIVLSETDLHPGPEGAHPGPGPGPGPGPEEELGSQLISHGAQKRKWSEQESGDCVLIASSSSSSSSGGRVLVAEWELELEGRRRQEEEDRRLALLLQKELDEEEKLRATDRRKGSADAYLLRRGQKDEDAGSSKTSRKTARTSSSSSSSSSSPATKTTKASSSSSSFSRGRKQTTLTEMFPSLNN